MSTRAPAAATKPATGPLADLVVIEMGSLIAGPFWRRLRGAHGLLGLPGGSALLHPRLVWLRFCQVGVIVLFHVRHDFVVCRWPGNQTDSPG